MSSASDSEPEIEPLSPEEPKRDKNVDDLLKELQSITLYDEEDVERPKYHDAGMAKLHALLTRKISSTATTSRLKRAAFKAEKSRKYYRRATQIFSQPDMSNIFPFLALPAELRLAIYQELLVTDDRLILNWRGPMKLHKYQKTMYIDIMQTCQLCAKEGAGVLYGENVFDFEDVRQRMSIGKPMLKRIGANNAALIRVIICEYSAPYEELSLLKAEEAETHQLTVLWLTSFFRDHGIDMDQLRVLAISISPFGHNAATKSIAKIQHPVLFTKGPEAADDFRKWIEYKNKGLGEIVDGICEREKKLRKADFEKDVARRIEFDMSPPVWGRRWVAYTE